MLLSIPSTVSLVILSLAMTATSSMATIDQASVRLSAFRSAKALVNPSFLRSHHRRLKNDDEEEDEDDDGDFLDKSTKDDDSQDEDDNNESSTSVHARSISISFSILTVESNTTTPMLQQVRPPVVACAVTQLLCQETDLNLTSSAAAGSATSDTGYQSPTDACRAFRGAELPPPNAIFGQRTENVTLSVPATVDRILIEDHDHGLAYLEWTLFYQPSFANDKGDGDVAARTTDQNAAELQALIQYTTDANVQGGTMDKVLKSCYQEFSDSNADIDEKTKLEIYSSVIGDESDVFSAYKVNSSTTNEGSLSAWLDWFTEQDLPVIIGMSVAAGALMLFILCLIVMFCRRRNRANQAKRQMRGGLANKPLPLEKATTVTTVATVSPLDISSSDDDEVTGLREEDFIESQAVTRVLGMLEHGSDSSMTGENYDDDADFSLYDERDYEAGQMSPIGAYYPSAGALLTKAHEEFSSDDEDEWFSKDDEVPAQTVDAGPLDSAASFRPEDDQEDITPSMIGGSAPLAFPDLIGQQPLSIDAGRTPSSDDDDDDTVTEASQGYASDGDEGLVLPAHEEDESSVATRPVLSRSRSMDSKLGTNLGIDEQLGAANFLRSKKVNSPAIFRMPTASSKSIHIKDLDSGRLLPLEFAVTMLKNVKNLDSGRVLPLESAASF